MLFLISCHDDDFIGDNGEKGSRGDGNANRTVLIYMMGENSLNSFLYDDIKEITQGVGSIPANDNLLVFVDGVALPYVCRYSANDRDDGVRVLCDTVMRFDEDVVSTDTAVLADVVSGLFSMYPAKSYGLVLWSHGDGWMYDPYRNGVKQRYIGIDNGKNSTSNRGRCLEIEELAHVLESELEKPLEFIFFDACLMQSVEVAYALRHCTRYILGSPCEIPGPGAPYQKMIFPMFADTADVKGMINTYYTYYKEKEIYSGYTRYGAVLSVIDCNEIDSLCAVTASFVPTYFNTECFLPINEVQRYYPVISSVRPEYFDMNGVMQAVLSEPDYALWKTQLDRVVPYKAATNWWWSNSCGDCTCDLDNYGGISCFVPRDQSLYPHYATHNRNFQRTEWYKAAGWDIAGW